mmetsp:Transcript_17154/g.20432  ORF Transcript_17154/g.20432 Transcript_17154/m.20432 type:complete len:103 (-) Transcript_17154:120-428(-)
MFFYLPLEKIGVRTQQPTESATFASNGFCRLCPAPRPEPSHHGDRCNVQHVPLLASWIQAPERAHECDFVPAPSTVSRKASSENKKVKLHRAGKAPAAPALP